MKKVYFLLLIGILPYALFSQTLFINEIHYDNEGADEGEGVEIAGPAGTDLTGWKLIAYNGNGGTSYSVTSLSGSIPDQMGGFGTIWFNIVGLQNGAPDGIALVDATPSVVQFLSYEGSITAIDGPASGLTSTDIMTSQSGAPPGTTIQLQGQGYDYSSFTWVTGVPETKGSPNIGQALGLDFSPPLWTATYPKLLNILDTQVDLHASLDEPGIVYYVVLPDDANPPTSDQVKAGVDYGEVTVYIAGNFIVNEAGVEVMETIKGTAAEESYDIYVVAEDDAFTANLQLTPDLIDVTMTAARSLVIISPQPDDTYNVGSTVTFRWTAANIAYIMIGGYDHTHSEYFILGDENEVPFIIDATPGIFDYTIPNSASTDIVDIIMFDVADTTFFTRVTPVNLVDAIDPSIVATVPHSGAIDVTTDASLMANFDEEIYTGTGSVTINKQSDNSIVESIDIASNITGGAIEINELVLILRPTSQFEYLTQYYIDVPAGIVVDYKDNNSVGVTGAEGWHFTTIANPFSSDATLSDIMIDGTTINGFSPEILTYIITLPANTATIPVITCTLADNASSVQITDATNLAGTVAERTTTVTVTAEDGTTIIDYTLLFNPILEVADLTTLRAATDYSRTYTVTGVVIVTAIVPVNNQKWVQDATSGMQVFDDYGVITTVYVEGDGVTGLTGTLFDLNGMLQLVPYSDPGTASSTGISVTPQTLTVNEFKTNFENIESKLVSIERVNFNDANGTVTFTDGGDYPVSVGADETVLRVHFFGTTVTGTVIPNTADVIGIAIWHYDEAKISPRFIEDVAISTGADITLTEKVRIYPVPVTIELTVDNIKGITSLEVLNMTGNRMIVRNIKSVDDLKIDVSTLQAGVYFIRLKTGNEVITRRFIKE